MKTDRRTDLVLLVGILLLAIGAFGIFPNRESSPSSSRSTADVSTASDAPAPATQPPVDVAERLDQLTAQLNATTDKLDATLARLESLQTEAAHARSEASRQSELQAAALQVPVPEIVDGSPVFRELPDPQGNAVARQVAFSGLYGRRLVFRQEEGPPLSFDVSELHPGVLAHLGIDPAAAIAEQGRLEESKRLSQERSRQRADARRQAQLEYLEARTQADLERARLIQEASARQAAQARSESTDQLLAAALLASQRPAAPTYVVSPPTYSYYVPWYPVTYSYSGCAAPSGGLNYQFNSGKHSVNVSLGSGGTRWSGSSGYSVNFLRSGF